MTRSELEKIIIDKFNSSKGDKDNTVEERILHSIGVCDMALYLNKLHNLKVDEEKITTAALLHDYAKFETIDSIKEILKENNMVFDETLSPKLWHSFYGVLFIKRDLKIDDEEILNAIYYHTTGRANMTNLEKLIFVSDFTETNTRIDPMFDEVRKASFISIDKACAVEAKLTVDHLRKKNFFICHETIDTYEFYKKYLENN